MKNRTKRIYAILIAVIFGLMTLADPAAVLAQDKGAVNPSQGTDKSQPVKTAPTGDVELNAENFPDEEFREYLKDNGDRCKPYSRYKGPDGDRVFYSSGNVELLTDIDQKPGR